MGIIKKRRYTGQHVIPASQKLEGKKKTDKVTCRKI